VANLWLEQDAGPLPSQLDVPSYSSGYVDGEGCFSVSISPRPTLLVGWGVRPSLSVSQKADRSEVLLLIQRYFGCGTLRPDRSDRTLKWEVRSLPLLIERVVPHFYRYPLLSGKQRDFDLRRYLSANGCRRSSLSGWVARDCDGCEPDEPERSARVPGESDHRELVEGEGIVCPPGNRGLR
jgi:hypothetical protein